MTNPYFFGKVHDLETRLVIVTRKIINSRLEVVTFYGFHKSYLFSFYVQSFAPLKYGVSSKSMELGPVPTRNVTATLFFRESLSFGVHFQ